MHAARHGQIASVRGSIRWKSTNALPSVEILPTGPSEPPLLKEIVNALVSKWAPRPAVDHTASQVADAMVHSPLAPLPVDVDAELAHDEIRYYVDCTVGAGDHAAALLEADPNARVLCIDRDPSSVSLARSRLELLYGDRVSFYCGTFAGLRTALEASGFPAKVHGILADLGVADHQLTSPSRGFSFRVEAPLDMRYNVEKPPPSSSTAYGDRDAVGSASILRAAAIVSSWPLLQLQHLFTTYGGIDAASAFIIAGGIVTWRGAGTDHRKYQSTIELRYVVEQSLARVAERRGSTGDGNTAGFAYAGKERPAPKWQPGGYDGNAGDRLPDRDATVADASSGPRSPIYPVFRPKGDGTFKKINVFTNKEKTQRILDRTVKQTSPYPKEVAAVFQALRMAANDEPHHLGRFLSDAPKHLVPGGRQAVISVQPMDDNAVVAAAEALTRHQRCPALSVGHGCECAASSPSQQPRPVLPGFRAVTPPTRPIRPTPQQVKANRRCRSARLRVLERTCKLGSRELPGTTGDWYLRHAVHVAVSDAAGPLLPRFGSQPRDIAMRRTQAGVTKADHAARLSYPFSSIHGSHFGYCVDDFQRPVPSEAPGADAGDFPRNIAEYLWTEEGRNDFDEWLCFARLTNGNYVLYTASCDYTGFDCSGDMRLIVSRTYEAMLLHGFDDDQYARFVKATAPVPGGRVR